MLSSDDNINSIAKLVEESKQWLLLKKEYTKLDVIEKTVRLLSVLVIAGVFALLLLLALIYFSFAAAYLLADICGSLPLAFMLTGCVYLLVLLLVYVNRRAWIEQPLVHLLVSVLADDSDNENTAQ